MSKDEKLMKVIMERLKQQPPKNCHVVPGSTPVIGFGRFKTAKVATISLNPSYHEFDIINGQRRFHTLGSLEVSDYNCITEEHVRKILDYCETYFERGIHFDSWFSQIEKFIQSFLPEVSYSKGTLCHLDICQWATEKPWRDLSDSQKRDLISKCDIDLIRALMESGDHEIALINGSTASNEILNEFFKIDYDRVTLSPSPNLVEGYFVETDHLFGVNLGRKIRVIGWNKFISKPIKSEHKALIIDWIIEKLGVED